MARLGLSPELSDYSRFHSKQLASIYQSLEADKLSLILTAELKWWPIHKRVSIRDNWDTLGEKWLQRRCSHVGYQVTALIPGTNNRPSLSLTLHHGGKSTRARRQKNLQVSVKH